MTTPELRTDRLSIDAFRSDDVDAYHRYRSDPEVARYQSWEPGSLEEANRLVREFRSGDFGVAETWFQFAIRLRSSEELVGDIGIHFLAPETRQAELGFTIAPAHQRQGYGSEAVTVVLDLLFGPLDKHRVTASVDPRNTPSIALLRRVGMRQEAHFRKSLWFKGEWADDLVFALLKSEWEEASR